MFLTPLFSSTCDLVCLILLSDLFNCLSVSAPFHHLSTHFLTEAVDSPCSKNLFFPISGSQPVAARGTGKWQATSVMLPGGGGGVGGTL